MLYFQPKEGNSARTSSDNVGNRILYGPDVEDVNLEKMVSPRGKILIQLDNNKVP